ncbi:MAG: calcium-binding protein [Nitrospirota bacterium]
MTGHSLGGFLAQAFTIDFPTNVTHTYTFNSPGFGGLLTDILDRLGIADTTVPSGLITNVLSQNGFSAAAGFGTLVGTVENIFIEATLNPITNHSIVTATDALALYDLVSRIDPNASISFITGILKASSSVSANSLEFSLNAFSKALLGPAAPITTIGDRESYYTNLTTLRDTLPATSPYRVDSLVGVVSSTVFSQAKASTTDGLVYRYALRELNPFVVQGVDYQALHNQDGSLDLYDIATGQGMWTQVALSDRAELLAEKIAFNQTDGSPASATLFVDEATEFNNGRGATAAQVVIFDADGNDLIGRSGDDHLYGGAGDDSIQGGEGRDYIEGNEGNDFLLSGGAGNDILLGQQGNDLLDGGTGDDRLTGGRDADILRGGQGTDTYSYRSGDGQDIIEDADGLGSIQFDQRQLQGGLRRASDPANTYTSQDGQFRYVRAGTTLTITNLLTNNGSVVVQHFTNGHLGIRLADAPPDPNYDNGLPTRTDFTRTITNPDGRPTTEPIFDETSNSYTIVGATNNIVHALGGDDTVGSDLGNDQLFGGDGNDTLLGAGGHDRLFGGAGHDVLSGDETGAAPGQDVLDGGDGNDQLFGGAGDDELLGGAGDDHLQADEAGVAGQDRLEGGAGSDVLLAGAGNDWLDGGTETDLLKGEDGEDMLYGGEGDWFDDLQGGYGHDVLTGGDGHDSLFGDGPNIATAYDASLDGSDSLDGGEGNDFLFGGSGTDVLIGGAGHDWLAGDYTNLLFDTGGNDLLDGGAGDDRLEGGAGDDTIYAGMGNDTLFGDNPNGPTTTGGNDFLDGEEGNDSLRGGTGHDTLSGGLGDDVLFGEEGDDVLDGGAGIDVLDGGLDDDRVHGGAGNDRLFAGQGTDTLFGDEGEDYLNSGNEYSDTGTSVLIGGAGHDTYVVDSAADTVIEEAASGIDTIESFVSYTLPDHVENFLATASGLIGTGNALDNEMRGSGSATLDGRAGNDTLLEGRTYVFGHGYGTDTIVEHDPSSAPYFPGGVGDAVQFAADVLPSHVRWQRSGDDLILSLDGTTDQLLIPSFYTVALNQGTYLFSSNIFLPGETVTAGGNPYYVAPSQVEQFHFADGTLWGPEAFDAPMIGAYHANVYRFGRGSGQDTILDFDFTSDQATDRIELGADVLPSDLTVSRVGDDWVLRISGTSDRLTVQSHFASVLVRPSFSFSGITVPAYRIEQVQFADGTLWDAAAINNQVGEITGTEASDFLQGNANDNPILGLGGDDTLHGQQGADVLDGGAGDDTLFGGLGADTYLFGRGSGHDTVYDDNFSGAEIDTVRLAADITPDDVTLQANGENGLVLGLTGTTDQLTLRFFLDGPVYEMEQLAFADGTTWDPAAMRARATGLSLTGTEEADFLPGTVLSDVLVGLGGDDFLDGREGDDTLRGDTGQDELAGRAGADRLEGGAGNDIYYFNPGDGTDTITDTAGPGEGNRIVFGEGIALADLTLTQSQNTLTIAVGPGGDAMRLTNFDPTGATGSLVVETLEFFDGSQVSLASLLVPTPTEDDDVLTFGSGDDVINALGGNDVVEAGAGNDTLMGGAGNDTLLGGTGNDVLDGGPDSDRLQGGEGEDTFRFSIDGTWTSGFVAKNSGSPGHPGTGQTVSLNGKQRSFDVFSDEAGVDTLRGTAGDDALALDDAFSPFPGSAGPRVVGIERIEVGDGHDLVDLTSPIYDYGDVSLDGGVGDDVLWASAGNDRLLGGVGKDHLYGGAGRDLLLGGDGNDILDGGQGADTLIGGLGNDTFIVDDAGEVVTEAANEGTDLVKSSITYTLGDHVENLTLTGTAAINGTGNALNNVLTGNSGVNVLAGGAGNDRLKGGKGNDTYVFGRGDGRDKIVEKDATAGNIDTLLFGAGINPLDLMLERSVNDLRMALYGSTDQVTIQNWYTGSSYQIETIRAGNGQQLLNTQVEQLLQAMAGFSAQTGLTWEEAIAQRPEDVQAILAANWQ